MIDGNCLHIYSYTIVYVVFFSLLKLRHYVYTNVPWPSSNDLFEMFQKLCIHSRWTFIGEWNLNSEMFFWKYNKFNQNNGTEIETKKQTKSISFMANRGGWWILQYFPTTSNANEKFRLCSLHRRMEHKIQTVHRTKKLIRLIIYFWRSLFTRIFV